MLRVCSAAVWLMLGACGLSSLTFPGLAGAQATSGLHATRAELEQMLAEHERGQATAADGLQRIQSATEAAAIRARLEQGDFQTGDQIILTVEGHPDLSDAFTVEPTQSIAIPMIGSIPLRGVLRSELQAHLTQHLAQFVRDPRIRAESTIRLVVMGAVGNPGFYSVPSHALVTDIIAQAGGTGRGSELTRIRIERNGRQLIGGSELQNAIIAGRTIDQLSVRAGDRVVVPERRAGYLRTALTVVGTTASLTYLFIRIRRGL